MTDRVVVLTAEEVRSGKLIDPDSDDPSAAEGAVLGYAIHKWPYGPQATSYTTDEVERTRAIDRDIELIYCAAGIVSEAVYCRKAFAWIGLLGGRGDIDHSKAIQSAWFPEDKDAQLAALIQAEQRASALVRSTMGATAIRAMADALYEKGEIEGEEVGEVCRTAYGGRECLYGAWNAHWPPTLAQIRAGFIPERHASTFADAASGEAVAV